MYFAKDFGINQSTQLTVIKQEQIFFENMHSNENIDIWQICILSPFGTM